MRFRRRSKMGIDRVLRQVIAISLLIPLVFAGDGAAQTGDTEFVRIGDRWSYDVKDALTGDLRHAICIVVVEVYDKEITTRTSYRGKDRPQTMIFDADWGRIDDGIWQLRPSGIGIKKPLETG